MEHRFKAIGTVVGNDLGNAFRNAHPYDEPIGRLKAIGKQRTAEARGEALRRDPWIPDSMKEAKAAGNTDADVLGPVAFYHETEYRHPNSTNCQLFSR